MIVVLRPYKHVSISSASDHHFDDASSTGGKDAKNKKMFIRELDPRSFINADDNFQMMTIEQHTRTRIKQFHICDAYDIASIKSQQEFQVNNEEDKSEIIESSVSNPLKHAASNFNKAHSIPG
jgi:hypothetical protein